MDVDKPSILLGACLLHDINHLLRAGLYGEICV
jgi:predicted HD phosphohydrolase